MCVSFRLRNLASLYDGAGILLMTGWIGLSGLRVLSERLRRGAVRFHLGDESMVRFIYDQTVLCSLL
jgi:hypothetical protein